MTVIMGCSQPGYKIRVTDSQGGQLLTYDSVPKKPDQLISKQRQYLCDHHYHKCRAFAPVVETIWPETAAAVEANRLTAWGTLFLYDSKSNLTPLQLEKRNVQILKEAVALFHKSGIGSNRMESEIMDRVMRKGFFERETFEQFIVAMRSSTSDLGSEGSFRRRTLIERFAQEHPEWSEQYDIATLANIPWEREQGL